MGLTSCNSIVAHTPRLKRRTHLLPAPCFSLLIHPEPPPQAVSSPARRIFHSSVAILSGRTNFYFWLFLLPPQSCDSFSLHRHDAIRNKIMNFFNYFIKLNVFSLKHNFRQPTLIYFLKSYDYLLFIFKLPR